MVKDNKFILTINTLEKHPCLTISEEQFEQIKLHKKTLQAALAIEEKYELLMCNYKEYERDVLEASLDHMLTFSMEYSKFLDERIRFNRRLVNILTASKMYMDQMERHLRDCLPAEDKVELAEYFKTLRSEQYNRHFEYAFFEALRNHAQHAGLCVSAVRQDVRNALARDELREWQFNTQVFCSKKFLSENPDFKKSVLKIMPDEVELTSALRQYISSIGEIHNSIRSKIEIPVNESRAMLGRVIESYNVVSGLGTELVHANHYSGSDALVEIVPIFLEWDNVRIALQQKNLRITNLAFRHVATPRYIPKKARK